MTSLHTQCRHAHYQCRRVDRVGAHPYSPPNISHLPPMFNNQVFFEAWWWRRQTEMYHSGGRSPAPIPRHLRQPQDEYSDERRRLWEEISVQADDQAEREEVIKDENLDALHAIRATAPAYKTNSPNLTNRVHRLLFGNERTIVLMHLQVGELHPRLTEEEQFQIKMDQSGM